MRRFAILILTCLDFFGSTAQELKSAAICDFTEKLAIRRATNFGGGDLNSPNTFSMKVGDQTYIGTRYISNYFMQKAVQDSDAVTLEQRFAHLCEDLPDFEKFIYQILIESEVNKDQFTYLIGTFCGSETPADKFYSFLLSKYRERIAVDIASQRENDARNPPNPLGASDDSKGIQNDLKANTKHGDTVESKFAGGDHAWQLFLFKNFKYPEAAINSDIQGTVIVEFVVDTLGNPKKVKAITGPEILGREAMDVINKSKWIPAKVDGRKVESIKYQPIVFKLWNM